MATLGQLEHIVRVENPSAPVPDGDGGFSQTWAAANPPTLHVSIRSATARDLERVNAGTVLAQGSYIMSGYFHPELTTQSRILLQQRGRPARVFSVLGPSTPDERLVMADVVIVEQVP